MTGPAPAVSAERSPVLGRALAGCLLLAAALAFHDLGGRPLYSPAEARYALIALEMMESGDCIQPRLNQVRYYEKPPLLYWSTALSYFFLGANDLAARVPSALAYVATTATTFLLAAELLGRSAGPLAALIYATSAGPFLFGRFLFADTLLVLWLSVALLGLAKLERRRPSQSAFFLFWGGMALAGLTKGVIGMFFPLASAATMILLSGKAGLIRRSRPLPGLALMAAIVLPWHIALAWRDPSFVRFYVVNEHVCRFLGCREPTDYEAMSVPGFWSASLLWFLPWSLLLPAALVAARHRAELHLPLVWSAWVFGFFTLAGGRLEYYALPALPALAVIVAAWWRRLLEHPVRAPSLEVSAVLLAVTGVAFAPLAFSSAGGGERLFTALVTNLDGNYREYLSAHPGAAFPFAAGAVELARVFVPLLLTWGVSSGVAAWWQRTGLAFWAWVGCALPFLAIVEGGHRLIAPERSQREMAAIVARYWEAGAHLVVAGRYYEEACGITWYTRLPTGVLDGVGGDLLFGYKKGDAAAKFLQSEQLERLWGSPKRVFVASGRELEVPGAVILSESPRQRLITNRPLAEDAGGVEKMKRAR
jgi:hypothetical protein